MNASLPRAHVVRLLELVRAATEAESGAALQLFSHVRLAAAGDRVEAAAMTAEVAARASCAATVTGQGIAAVSLRRALDAARTLSGDTVALVLKDGRLTLAGDDGAARLPTLAEGADQLLDPWTLPIPAELATVSVDAVRLRAGLAAVRHAVTTDEARAGMRGVRLEASLTGCRAVATDGARMAVAELGGVAEADVAVTLPADAVDAFTAALDGQAGAVQLDVSPDVCRLDAAGLSVRAVGIAVAFPPYHQALARMATVHAAGTIQLGPLAALLRRIIAVAGTTATRVTMEDAFAMAADDVRGQADGVVPLAGPRGAATLSLNPRLLQAAVDALGDGAADVAVIGSDQAPHAVQLVAGPVTCTVVRLG